MVRPPGLPREARAEGYRRESGELPPVEDKLSSLYLLNFFLCVQISFVFT
jgi:hypothetical protein